MIMALLKKQILKVEVPAVSGGDMTKAVYDPDENGKIDYNELENVGKRVFVSETPPSSPNVNDIWIKI